MSIPLPKDPLDDPIARFVTAVNEFLAIKATGVDPPQQIKTGNFMHDLTQNWEEFKRHLGRCHTALVGAQPEVAQRLEAIISVGREIKALTDDPNIVNPVNGVVTRATDERAEVGSIIPRIGNATSFPTVMSLIAELLGFGTRSATRRKEIADLLNDLTAYFLMKPPPRESA
jgi:hypothetical protein